MDVKTEAQAVDEELSALIADVSPAVDKTPPIPKATKKRNGAKVIKDPPDVTPKGVRPEVAAVVNEQASRRKEMAEAYVSKGKSKAAPKAKASAKPKAGPQPKLTSEALRQALGDDPTKWGTAKNLYELVDSEPKKIQMRLKNIATAIVVDKAKLSIYVQLIVKFLTTVKKGETTDDNQILAYLISAERNGHKSYGINTARAVANNTLRCLVLLGAITCNERRSEIALVKGSKLIKELG